MNAPVTAAPLSTEQLQGILDTAMDAVITVDASQRVVLINCAACDVFRLSTAQALGQPLDRFLPMRLQAAHREHVQQYAQHGQTVRRMGRLHRLVGLRADGAEFPLEASLSRLGEGDAVLMTVVLRDISERLELERAHEARLAAEATSRAKSQWLALMSHELRTPLHAILGFAQLLLQRDPPLAADAGQHVGHIRDAGENLLSMVDDLLELGRLEASALRIECRQAALAPIVDEAWALVARHAAAAAVHFEAPHRGQAPLAAWCDPRRLRQVLANLLSNAVKYNRPGGAVRVELDGGRDGDVRVVVEDTGVGMTPDQLAHLYEPFNRLGRDQGPVPGHGIGLALTRQLVQAMGGHLHIDSQPDRGTRVLLRLPARQPAS